MRLFVKKFENESGIQQSIVKIDVEDGEEITSEQAVVMLLNQIDDRLCDIAHNIQMLS